MVFPSTLEDDFNFVKGKVFFRLTRREIEIFLWDLSKSLIKFPSNICSGAIVPSRLFRRFPD